MFFLRLNSQILPKAINLDSDVCSITLLRID